MKHNDLWTAPENTSSNSSVLLDINTNGSMRDQSSQISVLPQKYIETKQRIASTIWQRTFYFLSDQRATRITLTEVLILFFMLVSLFSNGILPINPSINSYELWAQDFHDTFSSNIPVKSWKRKDHLTFCFNEK